ncbi:MAG: hypothetical protein E7232_08235 [Lachnospiraceae bacterium]|jgi:Flp pilus assembly protein protease CpaA|nr:hypothetical protein [Lachnospiraceae bacterium]
MSISFSISYFYLLIFLSYFFLASIYDLKSRSVPNLLHFLFILSGFPIFLYLNFLKGTDPGSGLIAGSLTRFIPGIILTLISIASKGGLGIGDAVFITVSAFFIPLNYILTLIVSGFLTAFITSTGILIYGKIKGKNLYSVSLPLIPLMLPGLYFILRDMEYTGGFL